MPSQPPEAFRGPTQNCTDILSILSLRSPSSETDSRIFQNTRTRACQALCLSPGRPTSPAHLSKAYLWNPPLILPSHTLPQDLRDHPPSGPQGRIWEAWQGMSGFLGPGQANTSLSSGASRNSCARDFLGSPAVRIQRSHCPWPWGSIPDLGTKIPQVTRGGKNKK